MVWPNGQSHPFFTNRLDDITGITKELNVEMVNVVRVWVV